ncbi:hypothetical protein E5S67_00491 [Microcoleus sp. IPMA8]|uniref:Uncharacterized protein n=1 Tax=Microcoleus asticus IPMA8 TaxID=2563858 RepID=A0ABX2CT78_9CYAN|nr:hypothetical protein [Microcoleus asticus IPMA8]
MQASLPANAILGLLLKAKLVSHTPAISDCKKLCICWLWWRCPAIRYSKQLAVRLLGCGKVKMQVIGAMISEVGAFGFWDLKIPKAFRPQLCDRYRLTGQDSIYKTIENIIVFCDVLLGMGIYSQKLVFHLLHLYYRNGLGIARELLLAKVGIARVFNCLVCCRA